MTQLQKDWMSPFEVCSSLETWSKPLEVRNSRSTHTIQDQPALPMYTLKISCVKMGFYNSSGLVQPPWNLSRGSFSLFENSSNVKTYCNGFQR